jgi:hypothetical protein
MESFMLGENVKGKTDGKTLILEIDLQKEIGPSGSGKNMKIASSGGNVTIPKTDNYKIGINVYKKPNE